MGSGREVGRWLPTFSTGGLPGGDVEHLGGHPDGPPDPERLLLGALHQLGAHCLLPAQSEKRFPCSLVPTCNISPIIRWSEIL